MNQSPDPNARLKQAAKSQEVPPFLEARILNQIRTEAPTSSWRMRWLVPATAVAAIFFGLGLAYQLGHLRLTVDSQESYIASMSNRVAILMRVGLGDHIHCAFFRKFPKGVPPLEEVVHSMGPQYSGLIPIVRRQVPAEYHLMLAHQCTYQGRKFVHLTLKNEDRLLSVVIARKGDGESFTTEGLLPALVESGIPIYQSGAENFAINAFESQKHLVYFISDLPGHQNAEIMAALAPDVQSFLNTL